MNGLTMSVSIEEISNIVQEDLNKLETELKNDLVETLKRKTPVNTGKSREGWKVSGNEIINDVEYIGYIETGTEHNRPVGMVSTTLKEVDSIIGDVIKRI